MKKKAKKEKGREERKERGGRDNILVDYNLIDRSREFWS